MKRDVQKDVMEDRIADMRKWVFHILMFLMIVLCTIRVDAATISAKATGNWSATGTWDLNRVPTGSDNVVIKGGWVVTVNGNYSCNNLTIGDAGSGCTVQITTSGKSLTINGALSINPNGTANSYLLNAGPGTINIAGTFPTWSTSGTNAIKVGTGVLNFTPAIAITSPNQYITFTGSGTVNFLSSFTDGYDRLRPATSCVVNFYSSYTVHTTEANWNVLGTAVFNGNGTITANSTINFNNFQTASSAVTTLASAAGAVNIYGSLMLDAGSTVTAHGDVSLVGNGAAISGTGVLIDSAGVVNITENKTINAGSALTFGSESISSSIHISANTTVDNGGTIVIYGGVTGDDASSIWTNNSSSYLSVTGELLSAGSIEGSIEANTIEYNGSIDQSVTAPLSSYYNLLISNAGTKTMAGPVQVDAELNISGSAVLDAGTNSLTGTGALTMSGDAGLNIESSVSGTYPELTGTYSLSGGTVTLKQTDGDATVAPAVYYNLILNGSTPYDLSGVGTISNNFDMQETATLNANAELLVGGLLTYSSSATTRLYNNITANGVVLTAGTFNDAGKNITIAGVEGWNNNGGSFASTGQIIFHSTDSIAQTIGGTAGTRFHHLTINNSGHNVMLSVSPSGTTTVTGYLELDSGHLVTDADNMLRMLDTAVVINSSSASYVSGPMVKVGAADFVFPVGNNRVLGKAGVTGITDPTTEVRAQYFNNAYTDLTSLDSTLSDVSNNEFWMIERQVSSDSLRLQLYWSNAAQSGIDGCDNLAIAHYTNNEWMKVESGVISGSGCSGYGSGSILSTGYISTFSPFTFGNRLGGTGALPVKLVSFNATHKQKVVLTNWVTAMELNNNYFTVERSSDGVNFSAIGQVAGAGNSTAMKTYEFADENPLKGVSYYRLRQTDYDGASALSNIVAVNFSDKGSVSLYPNPAKDQLFIRLNNPSEQVVVNIYDMMGRVAFSSTVSVNRASSGELIALHTIGHLPSGMYTVSISTNGTEAIEKFIVE